MYVIEFKFNILYNNYYSDDLFVKPIYSSFFSKLIIHVLVGIYLFEIEISRLYNERFNDRYLHLKCLLMWPLNHVL